MIITIEGTAVELLVFLKSLGIGKEQPVEKEVKKAGCNGKNSRMQRPDVTPGGSAKKPKVRKGSSVTLEEIIEEVDLSECGGISEAIEAIQLITNITGSRLAELLGINASDLTKARKGIIFPYIERAFKQHLQFPGITKPTDLQ